MYHRIGTESFDPWGLAVEERQFESQLQWLARRRRVLPLSEFARRHREGALPNDAVAITFDDGYASVMQRAVPLLGKYGLPATVFLPAERIDRGQSFWWDELAEILFSCSGKTLRLEDSDVRVPLAEPGDRTWAADAPPSTPRQQLFYSLWARLKGLPPAELDIAMADLRGQAGSMASPSDAPASRQELRQTSVGTVEFGSHALTHSSLPALERDAREREIRLSRERCLDLTGAEPENFAYPYGDYDAESMRLVEQAGFLCAVTSDSAFVTCRNHLFALPRIRVGNWDPAGLRKCLRGA